MLIQVYTLHEFEAVNARDGEVGADCLMHLDVLPHALGLAGLVSLALH